MNKIFFLLPTITINFLDYWRLEKSSNAYLKRNHFHGFSFAMNIEVVGIKTMKLKGDKEEYEMCVVMYVIFSRYWFQRSFLRIVCI